MAVKIPLLPFFAFSVLFLSGCAAVPARAEEIHSDVPHDTAPQVPDADLAELAGGNNGFAFDLYRQFSAGETNLVYSPYSVSVAFALLYAGADGRTAEQMAQALRYSLPPEALHPAFNRLALELASRSDLRGLDPDQAFQLSVANSIWGQSGFHFEAAYLDLLARNYAAGLRLADFGKDPESARRAINDWVGRSTGGKIKDILPPGAVDPLTRLVLANAVYFKAAWLHPFEKADTRAGDFHLLDGSVVAAPLMHQEESLAVAGGDGYRAVELPYANPAVSMLILLPDAGRFADVEARLSAALAAEAVAGLRGGRVRLTMPKFQYEWSQGLAGSLQALGMADAFDPDAADFSAMDGARDLHVSAALHKAFIAVDEAGTEAAAATVIVVGASALPGAPEDFTIDRPFFFLIRDHPTGTILFLGRVTNPAR